HRLRVYTEKNATVYYAQYSAFNELNDFYGPVRDKLLETFHVQAAQAVAAGGGPRVTSAPMGPLSHKYLSMPYPSNFSASTPAPKGEGKFSLVISGYRQDCSVRVDVFPAKGLTVEKVFEENSPNFKGRPGGESQISGQKAMSVNYTPVAGV